MTPEAGLRNLAEVSVWGSGSVRREILQSDDMADARVFRLNLPDEVHGSIVRCESVAPPSSTLVAEKI
jgi:GDP-L-fucose synthase